MELSVELIPTMTMQILSLILVCCCLLYSKLINHLPYIAIHQSFVTKYSPLIENINSVYSRSLLMYAHTAEI